MITLELSEYCLYSDWPKWLLAGWGFCGHFLAQTCTGLLVFSPVLEKMRAFIIAPRIKKVEQIREQVEDDLGSFSDLEDVEQRQYQYCLDEIDRIADELRVDAEIMTLGSYKLCLFGAFIAVLVMATSLDVFAGPLTLGLIWPLIVLSVQLRNRAKRAKVEAGEYNAVIKTIKANHSCKNTQNGLSAVNSLPAPASSPSASSRTTRSKNQAGGGGQTQKLQKK
ncbi:MAG: hypothetical protein ACI4O9_02450 [Akkermansia sp.]